MSMCIPCPAGQIPDTPTSQCKACDAGTYRSASMLQATCDACGIGYEAGPSNRQACTQW